MSGINYNLKNIKAFIFDVDGVLSPSTVPMGRDGQPRRMANVKDGYVIQLAVKLGYKICIITGGKDQSVVYRYNALGIKDVFLGAGKKLPILKEWISKNGLETYKILYMGDDIPDIPCLEYSGLSCCPSDASPEVKNICTYISKYKGGFGCVRDVISQVLKSQDNWMNDDDAFGW